jgi:hypothetical protein
VRSELADRGAEVIAHRALGEVEHSGDSGGGVVMDGRGEDLMLASRERAAIDDGGGRGTLLKMSLSSKKPAYPHEKPPLV